MSLLFKYIFVLNFLTHSYHPVHVSVTNLEYNSEAKEFNIYVKFFLDDFEVIIKNNQNVELNLGLDNQIKNFDIYIKKYIADNFSIEIDDKKIVQNKLKSFEYKIVDNSVWFYFSVKSKENFEKIKIKNSFLTDLYHDQTNLFIFTYNDFQKAIKFDVQNISDIIEIE